MSLIYGVSGVTDPLMCSPLPSIWNNIEEYTTKESIESNRIKLLRIRKLLTIK